MRLLWIPHTRWSRGGGHRHKSLIRELSRRHEIHVITWSEPQTPSPSSFVNPLTHLEALVPWDERNGEVFLHHIPRWSLHRVPALWRNNELILQRAVRSLVETYHIDAIIFGSSAYLVGYPPQDTEARLVFDHVDYLEDELLEKYLACANEVVCASRALQRQVERLGWSTTYLPNGVDLEAIGEASGSRIRAQYHIQDSLVVSLIGLTCSSDLYFAKSLMRFHQLRADARFLIVGKGATYGPLHRALQGIQQACIWTGWVPPDQVYDYFLATDVGLYPGADDEYFRAACPIKLLEYSAAGKPAVSSRVHEIDELGLDNVVQVDADWKSFCQGIVIASEMIGGTPRNLPPSWHTLAEKFEAVLRAG